MNFRFWRKKVVRAREFILEDAAGIERASLRMDGAGNTLLHFRGPDGQTRCFIGVTPDGTPRVGLTYSAGRGRIEIEANDQVNTAAIILSAPNGKAKLVLAMTTSGHPAIVTYDEQGVPAVFQPVILQKDTPSSPNEFPDWDGFLKL